jgi:PEP-CTERM motif
MTSRHDSNAAFAAPLLRTPHLQGRRRLGVGVWTSAVLVAVTVAASSAVAGPISISGLFNTGVDGSGNALPTNSTDTHWTIVSSPAQANVGGATNYYNGSAVVRSIDRWTVYTPDTATAKWIVSPQSQQDPTVPADPHVSGAAGNYVYQTTFTMPRYFYEPIITGSWACDNLQIKVFLNSTEYNITTPTGWGSFTNFSLTNGFRSGENTLQFVVDNDVGTQQPNPTGTFISLSGVYVVPEPSMATMATIGIGTMGLMAALRRRSRKTAIGG